MTDKVAVVIGATRGVGLALVRALLAGDEYGRVIATHRTAATPESMRNMIDTHATRLTPLRLDVTSAKSISDFRDNLAGLGKAIDLTIHSAGILHENRLQPEKSLGQCEQDALMRYFQVNSVAPLMVARALLPLQPRSKTFTYAVLSAMVGSIGDNRRGGWYGYRASKAALNQFVRTLAIESRLRHPEAAIVALHPGTTDTDLTEPFRKNIDPGKLYSPAQTAGRLLKVLENVDTTNSGQFLNWDGSRIPW